MENLINISERKNMDKDKALDTALAQIERRRSKRSSEESLLQTA